MTQAAAEPTVVVVGSINLDRRLEVDRLPTSGETVIALGSSEAGGGKGANQAVAAAQAGAQVVMVGAVGADEAGRLLLTELSESGVDITHVRELADTPSGTAIVAVERATGANLIVVDPGANGALTTDHLDRTAIASATVLVLQREIPDDVGIAAAELTDGFVLLNPAPASTGTDALIALADLLVPNEHELAVLTQTEPSTDHDEVVTAVGKLPGDCDVLVTLGARGALLVRRPSGEVATFPAPRVDAIDTTGAGDQLCGVLAAGLAAGLDLPAAVERAIDAASVSTLHVGARVPRR